MHRPTGPAPENPVAGRSGVAARGRLSLLWLRTMGKEIRVTARNTYSRTSSHFDFRRTTAINWGWHLARGP